MAACGTSCLRKHVRKGCAPKTDLVKAYYACPEDVTLTFGADDLSINQAGVITNIVVDNGVNAENSFHELEFVTEGDNKGTNTFTFTANDDGTEDKNDELILFIDDDNPGLRAAIEALENNEHDWILQYPGEDFPFDYHKDLKLTNAEFSSETRGWTLTFTKTNPEKRPTLIWNTDFSTTDTMIQGVIES